MGTDVRSRLLCLKDRVRFVLIGHRGEDGLDLAMVIIGSYMSTRLLS